MVESKGRGGLTQIGQIPLLKNLAQRYTSLTPIQTRLTDGAALAIENPEQPCEALYQYTVLCQTCLPFRDPGNCVTTWERLNGNIHLKVKAGEAIHPEQERFVQVDLPFGLKAP